MSSQAARPNSSRAVPSGVCLVAGAARALEDLGAQEEGPPPGCLHGLAAPRSLRRRSATTPSSLASDQMKKPSEACCVHVYGLSQVGQLRGAHTGLICVCICAAVYDSPVAYFLAWLSLCVCDAAANLVCGQHGQRSLDENQTNRRAGTPLYFALGCHRQHHKLLFCLTCLPSRTSKKHVAGQIWAHDHPL